MTSDRFLKPNPFGPAGPEYKALQAELDRTKVLLNQANKETSMWRLNAASSLILIRAMEREIERETGKPYTPVSIPNDYAATPLDILVERHGEKQLLDWIEAGVRVSNLPTGPYTGLSWNQMFQAYCLSHGLGVEDGHGQTPLEAMRKGRLGEAEWNALGFSRYFEDPPKAKGSTNLGEP